VIIEAFTVGPFAENCYLLADAASGDAVLVDPGDEGDRLVAAVEGASVELRALWITHGHVDHIGGIAAVKRRWDVPVFLHPLDEPLYRAGARQAAYYGLPFDVPPLPERALAEGDRLTLGSLSFDVLHVPGHAPGHVAFLGHGVVFGGDCLFAGSIGRTDLPLSSPTDLASSLDRLSALPGATRVLPGHGAETTIEVERRSNPFLTGAARLVAR
jgi:hydroxyacylglutathione hydrolase